MAAARRQPAAQSKPEGSAPPRREPPTGDRSRPVDAPVDVGALIRQYPVAALSLAAGVGVLLQLALTAASERPARAAKRGLGTAARREAADPAARASAGPAEREPKPEAGREAPPRRRREPATHDVGVADMEFTSTHPDGKSVVFRFAWKKRPIEAAETDWPTDDMGFTAERAGGKRTAFRFMRKTRPIPTESERRAGGDRSRPGLGWAEMEFTSSRPGEREFRFTWTKTPPPAGEAEASHAPQPPEPQKRADRPAALRVVKSGVAETAERTPDEGPDAQRGTGERTGAAGSD